LATPQHHLILPHFKKNCYNKLVMPSKKTFSKKQLETLSAEEIIKKIQTENYSLLTTLGGEKLRKEMVPVGKACHLITKYFLKTTGPKNDETLHHLSARHKLAKTMNRFAPSIYDREAFRENTKNGLVIGFNHPSLSEILRLIALKMDVFDDKPMLFPVNLPWYESIAKDYDDLLKLGIIITPTITPATWDKLAIDPKSDLYDSAQKLKTTFRHIYTDMSIKTLQDKGIIFVAPSATRQATVFKNQACYDQKEEILPTMSMLALKIYSNPKINCDFFGIAVLPPKNSKRGLNLGKTYRLFPTEPMTASYIRKTYFKTKNPKKLEGFDHDFLSRIAKKLPKYMTY